MKVHHSKILFADFEMTCGYGPEIVDTEVRQQEIIQVGVVEVDTNDLSIIRTKSIYVKPVHGHITEYCTNLTGITQEMVDNAPTLGQASKALRRFGTKSRVWYAWGNDADQVRDECERKKVPNPFCDKHVDLLLQFAQLRGTRKKGLKKALGALELEFEGNQHCALDDSINTARIWIELAKKIRN